MCNVTAKTLGPGVVTRQANCILFLLLVERRDSTKEV